MPPYIQVCHDIMRKRCPNADVRLLGPADIPNLLGKLPYNFEELRVRGKSGPQIALKVDYIRIALLHKFGGLWLDIDSILLTDVADFVEKALVDVWHVNPLVTAAFQPYTAGHLRG